MAKLADVRHLQFANLRNQFSSRLGRIICISLDLCVHIRTDRDAPPCQYNQRGCGPGNRLKRYSNPESRMATRSTSDTLQINKPRSKHVQLTLALHDTSFQHNSDDFLPKIPKQHPAVSFSLNPWLEIKTKRANQA